MTREQFTSKVGIFGLIMLSMATLVITPVRGLVVAAFPNQGLSQVQMILVVAQLTGILAAFAVGRLALTVSSKIIAVSGAFGTFIFGLLPFFTGSFLGRGALGSGSHFYGNGRSLKA